MTDTNDSVIGRLLQEVSWEGRSVRRYRDGGIGLENVLVGEVISLLESLPRTAFLGAVIDAATGADAARANVVAQLERTSLLFLGEHDLGGVSVQPDVELSSPTSLAWIEAKRLKSGVFGANQLSRQIVTLLREADDRQPLHLVLTPDPPPIPVQGNGRMPLHMAVELGLDRALELRDGPSSKEQTSEKVEALTQRLPDIMAWVTWDDLREAIETGSDRLPDVPPEVNSSIKRQVDRLLLALEVHG